jgi:hypothetical protein
MPRLRAFRLKRAATPDPIELEVRHILELRISPVNSGHWCFCAKAAAKASEYAIWWFALSISVE